MLGKDDNTFSKLPLLKLTFSPSANSPAYVSNSLGGGRGDFFPGGYWKSCKPRFNPHKGELESRDEICIFGLTGASPPPPSGYHFFFLCRALVEINARQAW